MPGKLFIDDTYDEGNADQAEGRFSGSTDVTTITFDSIEDLREQLNGLLRRDEVQPRPVSDARRTRDYLVRLARHWRHRPSTGRPRFAGRVFHRPFPFDTLVCFGGCGVGAVNSGTQLLIKAGKMSTRSNGGEVFALTNLVRVPGVDAVHRRQKPPTPGTR